MPVRPGVNAAAALGGKSEGSSVAPEGNRPVMHGLAGSCCRAARGLAAAVSYDPGWHKVKQIAKDVPV